MQKLLQRCLLSLLMTGALLSLGHAADRGMVTGVKMSSLPDWFKDSFLEIAEDVDEANEQDKHVILFMELNGCPYCYKMVEENFKHAPYKSFIQENFDVIALNVKGDREVALNASVTATEKEIAEQLGVRFTPGLVFLDSSNKPVVKVNGYRNVRDFKVILDYVQRKAYKEQKLAEYVRANKEKNAYTLRTHPQFSQVKDLSSVKDQPLMLLFEDSGCIDCDSLHDGHLADEQVKQALKDYTVVRVDAFSDQSILDLDGNQTTEKELAVALGVSYTPSIILIDRGKEMLRINNMLYRFHFTALLEYVGARHYEQFSESPFEYVNAKTEKLLAEGKDVSLADE